MFPDEAPPHSRGRPDPGVVGDAWIGFRHGFREVDQWALRSVLDG